MKSLKTQNHLESFNLIFFCTDSNKSVTVTISGAGDVLLTYKISAHL